MFVNVEHAEFNGEPLQGAPPLLELRRGDLQRDRLVHEVPDVAGRPGEVLEADLAHALIGQAVCSDGAEPGITK